MSLSWYLNFNLTDIKGNCRSDMSYRAEYIWVDGQKPTAKLRSKGQVIADGEEPSI